MPSPSPQAYGDVRLRLDLPREPYDPLWPEDYLIRQMESDDARQVHQLLVDVFGDEEPDFDRWYDARTGDAEYDAALNFVAEHIPSGEIRGAAWCWSGNYVKDLAVRPIARGTGLGRALFLTALNAFIAREAPFVDLKTNRHKNATAVRLYESLGMREVDWSGAEPGDQVPLLGKS